MWIRKRRSIRMPAVLAALLVAGLLSAGAVQQKQTKRPGRDVRRAGQALRFEGLRSPSAPFSATDRVLLRFKPGVSADAARAVLESYGLRDVKPTLRLGFFKARVPEGLSAGQTVAMLRLNPDMDYAGPDFRTHISVTPNDPFFSPYQYNLYNHGIVLDIGPDIQPRTKADADIKARAAWDRTKGSPDVVIAILDTGVDMSHPELVNKVISTGRDFVNGDMDATDDNSHGTFVAGVAAAETDNDEGIAGVAWNCMVLPVKVMDAEGNGYYSDLIDGLTWAADNGAKVINLSLGGEEPDLALEEACRYAFEKNVVIVASSGNEGGPVAYPAAYAEYVLAVSATDYEDAWASFSNSGPEVDVAAPGVYILGPVPEWYAGPGYLPYAFGSGTSAAAPHVAGMAALLLSVKPWLIPGDLMNVIRYTADDVNAASDPGRDDLIGYGRINMERALVPYKLVNTRFILR